jgi:hypothetical protein
MACSRPEKASVLTPARARNVSVPRDAPIPCLPHDAIAIETLAACESRKRIVVPRRTARAARAPWAPAVATAKVDGVRRSDAMPSRAPPRAYCVTPSRSSAST